MDSELFYSLCRNPEEFTMKQIKEIAIMSKENLEHYQDELELYDGDDLSSMDHLQVLYSLLYALKLIRS